MCCVSPRSLTQCRIIHEWAFCNPCCKCNAGFDDAMQTSLHNAMNWLCVQWPMHLASHRALLSLAHIVLQAAIFPYPYQYKLIRLLKDVDAIISYVFEIEGTSTAKRRVASGSFDGLYTFGGKMSLGVNGMTTVASLTTV